jgi:uncharacterized damage-inducible protein DinB
MVEVRTDPTTDSTGAAMSNPTAPATELSSTTGKEQFLGVFEQEHRTTMRVLRAYPAERLELQPHPKSKTARDLAWTFVIERHLGIAVFKDEFADQLGAAAPPPPPDDWNALLGALEDAHHAFAELIRSTPEAELQRKVRFFTAPKTMGEITRMQWLWFLLHDEIHHRGQFSTYLRMADGRVPSIYGPTADEPWM